MNAEHNADIQPFQNKEEKSPWGGVVLVTCGAVLMLLPIVAMFIGLSRDDDIPVQNSENGLLGSSAIGLVFSFFGGGMILLTGIDEVKKYPPRYRLRAILSATTLISISLGLIVWFVHLVRSAHE
jgi:hypothetical protein